MNIHFVLPFSQVTGRIVSAILLDMEMEIEKDEEWLAIPTDLHQGNANNVMSERRAYLLALVLEARYVPCRLEHVANGWLLLVPPASFGAALNELLLFEEENRNWPPPLPPANTLTENTLSTMGVLILLATFHNITQIEISLFGHAPLDLIAVGSADSARILGGQWWRLVTALTLHADGLHLVSNLAIGGIFIIFLCRELGSGLAWCLLLGSGIFGNLVNAFVQPFNHSSVGASTAVFGAVGILAALSLVRHRHHLQHRWPLPVAAALGLLALLGTEGKNTDLGAHMFGFVYGIFFGLLAEYCIGKHGRPGWIANILLALLGASIVAASWWAALALGS